MTREQLDSSDEAVSFPPPAGYAQAILENAQDAAFVIRRDLRIVYVNNRAIEVTGLERKEIVGQPVGILKEGHITDDQHLTQITQCIVDILKERRSHVEMHMPLHTEGMGTVTGHIQLSAIEGEEQVEHVGGVLRRLPETQFSMSPRADDLAYKKIVDQSPHGICFTTRKRFVYVNEQFQELLDYAEHEFIEEKTFTMVMHFGDQFRVDRILRELIDGEQNSATFDCRLKTREKKLIPVKAFATPLIYNDEPIVGLRIIRAGSRLSSFKLQG